MQKLTAFPLIALLVFAACDDGSQQNTRPDADIDAAPTNDGGVVDDTPPDTTITQAPPVATKDPSSTFEFSSTEAGMLRCRIDGAAYAACTSPDTRVLSEGEHTFEVVAVDLAGNEDPTPATHTWTIDTTPPETTITDAPAAPLDSSADASFSFESEEGALFECSLDGSSFALCASPFTATGLADAEHTFRVRAFDAVGNADPTPASHTWTIDTTFPETVIGSGPSGATSSTGAVFSFSSVDGISFECRVDGGAWQACTTGLELSGLADGAHTFEVRARDATGNYDPSPASQTWTVDTVDPDTSIVSGPAGSVPSDDATFTFSSTEGGATYECSLDGAAFAACPSPATFGGLSQGEHTLRVRAIDAAGNADASPVTRTWTVDTQGPTVAITNGPSDPSNATTAAFTFASADPSATFQCRLGVTAAYAACASGESLSGLSEGTHTFYVRAADAAGNVGPAASYSWTIDVGGPVVTITTNPQNPSGATMPRFAFTANEAGATFECRVDGAAYQGCPADVTLPALTDGEKTFYVRATDVAGNTGTPATYTWLVDSTPPAISIDATPDVLTNDATPTFSFTAIDATAVTFECRIGAGAAYTACASPFTFPTQTDGPKTFYVRATDAVENTALPATFSWTIDATDPVIAIGTRPDELSTDTSPSFSFSSVDGSVAFECRIGASAAYAPCTSPAAYGPLADGPHTFYVRGRDAAGNVTVPSTYSWIIDATDPVVVIASTPEVLTNSSTPTFTFSATDASTVTFECKIGASAAFGPCQSPNAYPVQTDGPKTFYVRGTDEAGNVSAVVTYDWTIDTGEPDTTIGSGPNGAVSSTGATFAFSSDEGGATYQCRIDSGTWTDCTSSRVLTGLTQGEHTFDVRAVDPAGNIDASPASRTWTVDTINPDTAIASGPTGTVAQTGATFTFTSDEAGATFECRLDLADWAGCDTPLPLSGLGQGPHTLRVRASDAAENTDASPATRTWTVDTQGPTVTIATGPESPTNSTSAVFTFTASEADSTFECRTDDGSAYSSCNSGDTFTVSEGARTFYVRATDTVGNVGIAATFVWSVDVTAADTSIDSGPTGAVASTSATFSFSSVDGVRFQCRVDTGAWANCTSSHVVSGLGQGEHTFGVRATDAVGNTDASPATQTWTVDTVNPDTTIASGPTGTVAQTGATFTFTSDEAGATFECRLDLADWAGCVTPLSLSGLGQGPHTLRVRAIDAAENTDASPSTRTWTVDTQGPTVTIATGPASPTNSTSAVFTFTASEVGSTFECRTDDGSAYSSCSSGDTFTVSEGARTFYVRATDAVDNLGAVATFVWNVDVTDPVLSITAGPTGFASTATATFSFAATDALPVSYSCRVDGTVASYTSCTSPRGYAGPLAQGAHTFYVRATDAAGNTAVAERAWTVDSVNPVVTINDPKPASLSGADRAAFSFSAVDATSVGFECRVDGTAANYAACTSPKLYAGPLADGPHTFYVRGTDAAGNRHVATHAWTIDATDPVVSIAIRPKTLTSGTGAYFTFSAVDVSSVVFECRVDGTDASYASCTSPRNYAGPYGDGPHTFYVRGTDAAGNVGTAQYTWTVDATAPVVTIDGATPAAMTNAQTATFSFSATDANAVSFHCRIDGSVANYTSCTSSKLYAGPIADGAHTFYVRGTDAAGNTDVATHEWTVDATDPVVTIGATKPAAMTSNKRATFSFSADDATAVRFECRIDGTTATYSNCTSLKTYAGPIADGPHTFYVRGRDAAGNEGVATYDWTVDSLDPVVTIGSPTPALFSNETSATFVFSATDLHTVTFECRLDGTDANYADCTSGQTYAGPISQAQHRFYVRGTDEAGNSHVDFHTWTIDTTRPVVSISAPASGSVSRNGRPTMVFTATDANLDRVECRIDGEAYAACTSPRTFLAGSTTLASGTHTARVRATDSAGNARVRSSTWTVDRTAPQTTVASNASSPWPVNYATITFTSSEAGSSFECSTNGGSSYFGCTSPRTLTGLAWNAVNKIRVRARDAVGNRDASPAVLDLNVQRGLILRYAYAGRADNLSVLGSKHDGVAGPAVRWVSGPFGKAAQFSPESDDVVRLANTVEPMSVSGKYTVATWFRGRASLAGVGSPLLSFYAAGGGCLVSEGPWVMGTANLTATVGIRCAGQAGFDGFTTFTMSNPGDWHHLALVYDGTGKGLGNGSDVRVYLDTRLVAILKNGTKDDIFNEKQLPEMTVGGRSNFDVDETRVYTDAFDTPALCTVVIGGSWNGDTCDMPFPGLHLRFDGVVNNTGKWTPLKPAGSPYGYKGAVCEQGAMYRNGGQLLTQTTTRGVSQYVGGAASHSVGAWFREDSIQAGGAVIDFRGEQDGIRIYHEGTGNEMRVCFRHVGFRGITIERCGSIGYGVGEWNHIGLRHKGPDSASGGDVEVFLNGRPVLVIQNSGRGDIFASADTFVVGSRSNVWVDDVKLYDAALSDELMCSHLAGMLWIDGSCKMP